MLQKLQITLFISAASFVLAHCGGSKASQSSPAPPGRTGGEYVSVSQEYAETNPRLNDAGDKVVFISGKKGDFETSVLKVYKSTWPADNAPETPKRATSTDASIAEIDVEISPSGEWIAIKAISNNQTDLYLQDYSGTNDPIRVTNDAAVESSFSFNSDSTLLAFASKDLATQKTSVYLTEIDSTSETALTTKKLTEDGDSEEDVFWIPATAAPFTLVTSTVNLQTMLKTFSKRTFNTLAAALTATKEGWLEDFSMDALADSAVGSTGIAAGSQWTIFARRVVLPNSKTTPRAGDKEEEEPTIISVETEPVFVTVADGTETVFTEPPGHKLLSLSADKTGAEAFWVSREAFHCEKAGGSLTYKTGLIHGNSDGTTFERILPRTSDGEGG